MTSFFILKNCSTGDIRDEKKVLAWFTDQNNLELADQIEEVNEKMLKKLIGSSAHVVAFFCELSNRKHPVFHLFTLKRTS